MDSARDLSHGVSPATGLVVWLTGLSGSGKTTIAQRLTRDLAALGMPGFALDGDRLRAGLNSDLGFSPQDRAENIRRAAAVAGLLADAGLIVLASFIAPYRSDRERARESVGSGRFVEVHVDAPLEVCERRDVKGHYRRARAGELPDFTGVSAPYEPPLAPDLRVDTSTASVQESADRILAVIQQRMARTSGAPVL